ncbi:THO complex subunit 3, partial [Mytilus galloprovincialis]
NNVQQMIITCVKIEINCKHQFLTIFINWRKFSSENVQNLCCVNFNHNPNSELSSKDLTFRGHGDSVDQLCWHPKNPDQLVTASGDKTVRIWDARTNKAVATVNTKGENINICWSPDGTTIAVGNKEDLITFIDVRSHRSKAEEQFKFEINEISWNNDGDLFFLTSGQGNIHIMSYPELKMQHVLHGHPANCICIEFDPMGKYFATGSADALCSLWDVGELVCVRTFARLEWPVRTLSFSHDGKMLASASEDLVIDISDVKSLSYNEGFFGHSVSDYARVLVRIITLKTK